MNADAGESAEDEQIEDEDGQPAGKPLRADGEHLLPLDEPDDRAEANGEEAAHVDEEQHVADEVGAPEDDDRKCGDGQRPQYERLLRCRVVT